jgi:hypothetical protein
MCQSRPHCKSSILSFASLLLWLLFASGLELARLNKPTALVAIGKWAGAFLALQTYCSGCCFQVAGASPGFAILLLWLLFASGDDSPGLRFVLSLLVCMHSGLCTCQGCGHE